MNPYEFRRLWDTLIEEEKYISAIQNWIKKAETNGVDSAVRIIDIKTISSLFLSKQTNCLFPPFMREKMFSKIQNETRIKSLILNPLKNMDYSCPEPKVGEINVLAYDKTNYTGKVFKLKLNLDTVDTYAELNKKYGLSLVEPILTINRQLEKYLGFKLSIKNHFDKDKSLFNFNLLSSVNNQKKINIEEIEGNSIELGAALAYYSSIFNRQLPSDIAVTGELKGSKIHPVKSVYKKIEGALAERPYITRFIIPINTLYKDEKYKLLKYANFNNVRIILRKSIKDSVREENKHTITIYTVNDLNEAIEIIFPEHEKFENKYFQTIIDTYKQMNLWKENDYDFIEYPPKLNKSFVGREVQIKCVQKWISDNKFNGQRTLCISGDPGIGKTALIKNLHNQINQQQLAIVYYFMGQDGKKRCSVDHFFRALSIQIATISGIDIFSTSSDLHGTFVESLNQFDAENSGKKIVFFIDGLDEFIKENPDDQSVIRFLFNTKLSCSLFIIAGQEQVFDPQLLKQDHIDKQIVKLNPLNKIEICEMLKDEIENDPLLKNVPDIESIIGNEYIGQLTKSSAGLPHFIRFFLDEIRSTNKIRQANDIPIGIDKYYMEIYNQLFRMHPRRKSYFDDVFSLLTIVREPLSLDTINTILDKEIGAELLESAKVLLEARKSKSGVTKWDYKYFQYKDYFAAYFNLEYTQDKLLNWCSKWQQNRDPYIAHYYPEHLKENSKFKVLFDIAEKNDNNSFINFQKEHYQFEPSVIFNTSKVALQAAIENIQDTDITKRYTLEMCKFTLIHSNRIWNQTLTPLKALLESGINGAESNLEFIEDRDYKLAWYLLLVWDSITKEKHHYADFMMDKFKRLIGDDKFPEGEIRDVLIVLLLNLYLLGVKIEEGIFQILKPDDQKAFVKKILDNSKLDLDRLRNLILIIKDLLIRNYLFRLLSLRYLKDSIGMRSNELLSFIQPYTSNYYWVLTDYATALVKNKKYEEAENIIFQIPDNFIWQKIVFWVNCGVIYITSISNTSRSKYAFYKAKSLMRQLYPIINSYEIPIKKGINEEQIKCGKTEKQDSPKLSKKEVEKVISILAKSKINYSVAELEIGNVKHAECSFGLSMKYIKKLEDEVDRMDLLLDIFQNLYEISKQFSILSKGIKEEVKKTLGNCLESIPVLKFTKLNENKREELPFKLAQLLIKIDDFDKAKRALRLCKDRSNCRFITANISRRLFKNGTDYRTPKDKWKKELFSIEAEITLQLVLENRTREAICRLEKILNERPSSKIIYDWGIPRILGEIASKFETLNSKHVQSTFRIAEYFLQKTSIGNDEKKVWPLLNLARAMKNVPNRTDKILEILKNAEKYSNNNYKLLNPILETYFICGLTKNAEPLLKQFVDNSIKFGNPDEKILRLIEFIPSCIYSSSKADALLYILNKLKELIILVDNPETQMILWSSTAVELTQAASKLVLDRQVFTDPANELVNEIIKKQENIRIQNQLIKRKSTLIKALDRYHRSASLLRANSKLKWGSHINQIGNSRIKSKALKDITLLKINDENYDDAEYTIDLIQAQISEHLPDIGLALLEKNRKNTFEYLLMNKNAINFVDSAIRMLILIIKFYEFSEEQLLNLRKWIIKFYSYHNNTKISHND